jgi:hypothetical protein
MYTNVTNSYNMYSNNSKPSNSSRRGGKKNNLYNNYNSNSHFSDNVTKNTNTSMLLYKNYFILTFLHFSTFFRF